MKKFEDPVVVILMLVATLIIGILTGAIAVGKYLVEKFKRNYSKLKKFNAQQLKYHKDKSTAIIKEKEEANKKYREIIEELINLLYEKDEKGRSVADTKLGGAILSQIIRQSAK